MLKYFSNAGMAKWDGFGWGLHCILHHIWNCLVLHIASCCMAYYMAQQFTTPTMFSTIKSIQLFQLRKFYDNCLIVRLVLHCTALLKAPHYNHYHLQTLDRFYMKSKVLNSRQNA